MKYYNIDYERNLDANSYYRVTANVKMLDDTFDKYQFNEGYGWPKIWGDERLASYYAGIPSSLRGKLMTSPKKRIDYWEKRGFTASALAAIVSQKFMDVLNDLGVNPDEYITKPVEMINSEEKFYMLFVPGYHTSIILPELSVFIRKSAPYDTRRIVDTSKLDDPNNKDLEIRKAVLPSSYGEKDFINIVGIPNYFVSERLLNALRESGIKGYAVKNKYELEVLESRDDENMSLSPSLELNLLSEAVIEGDMVMFDSLLSKDIYVEMQDGNGLTPLYYAAMYGRIDMAERLVSSGANIEFRDKEGNTPLMQSCLRYLTNGPGIINSLLSMGADAYAENKYEQTPLSISKLMIRFPETDLQKYIL